MPILVKVLTISRCSRFGAKAWPESIDDYLISGQNRRRHAAELQDRLRLRPFGRRPASELASSLLRHAMESDRLVVLAGLVIQECRQRGIVVPSPRSLERLCVDLRHQARREIERRLTGGLLAEQRRRLDALTERRAEGGQSGQSWLVWLRQMPEVTKPAAMLGLIERLNHVRAIGIDPARGHRVHQGRLAQPRHSKTVRAWRMCKKLLAIAIRAPLSCTIDVGSIRRRPLASLQHTSGFGFAEVMEDRSALKTFDQREDMR